MENNVKTDLQTKRILEGLEKAYQKLVAFKKYKKSPLIISQNGIIVEIHPDSIEEKTTYTATSKD